MENEQNNNHYHYHYYYGRGWGPITKSDVIIARICLFAVKFAVLLFLAFVILLMIIF